jgi:hypothetical protein
MDSNWWLLRGLLSRRVMRLCSGLLGVAVVFVFFFGPLRGWTLNTIQDRATSLAEGRAERIEEALGLPAESSTETIRFSVPREDAHLVARGIRAGGYSASIDKSEGSRWRVTVRDVPSTDVGAVRDLILRLSPGARSLPKQSR